MGLTASSTGTNSFDNFSFNRINNFVVAIAGNPNVGKSTIFNGLTGMHQHTGNWPGKTVANACGHCNYKNKNFLLVDIPGTYSLMSNSEEEEIARNFICFDKPDVTVVIVDATCLERNLNLVYQTMEITNKLIVCVNLLDEAKRKGIIIDLDKLENALGVPVVGTIAKSKKSLNKLLATISDVATEKITCSPKKIKYHQNIENILTKIVSIIENIIPANESYITRWIALKLLNGNTKIIDSIEKNFNISLDFIELESYINSLNKKSISEQIIASIIEQSENVCHYVNNYIILNSTKKGFDKIITSKFWGIPIMLTFLMLILWITIIGANYPSKMLSTFFAVIQQKLLDLFTLLNSPWWITDMLVNGMYQTLTWIISVMLPPMAIFFPLFTLLEDLGILPRIAFNLDKYFKNACTSGKQSLTMCMGLGCNAAGIIGTRIIDSPREKLIAILTNNFMPCNGRFPLLITIASIFIGSFFLGFYSSLISSIVVILIILLGIFLTMIISKILSKTILKGLPTSFVLELPPYRKPQISKIFIHSIFGRTLFVLGRAVIIAAPAGIVLWIFANISFNNITLLTYIANFLNPFGKLMGLDGYILTAFILGVPANEIVFPIILMCYLSKGTLIDLADTFQIKQILLENGWTLITAINTMIFTLLHFPCTTSLLSIKKETNSWKWVFYAFIIPTICGIIICILNNLIFKSII